MLLMLNLNWKLCDIDAKVTAASRGLRALVKAMGAGHRVQFDLTSLGAGEIIFPERPGETKLPRETLDFLREQHGKARLELARDPTFSFCRDMARTLKGLQADRHKLVAIHHGEGDECREQLKRARLSDYFGDHVYGIDSVKRGKPSLTRLYNQVMVESQVNPHDAAIYRNNANDQIIIDETEGGMRASQALDVVGLGFVAVASCADEDVAERAWRMHSAGARAIATTPHDLGTLPYTLFTRPDERARLPSYVSLPGAVILKAPKP
ncbi:MAG TPA: HAD hydrolase-like protein [Micavibrio sp.]